MIRETSTYANCIMSDIKLDGNDDSRNFDLPQLYHVKY